MTHFSDWLLNELNTQGISQAELARKSKLTRGAISNFINRGSVPYPENCLKLAKALQLPPETVLQAAGYLPSGMNKSDPYILEIIAMFEVLSQDERRQVVEIARTFYSRHDH